MSTSKEWRAKLSSLLVILTVIGAMNTAVADPDESQRLRGLGDRVFLVNVDFYVDGELQFSFPNCYFFTSDVNADGNKIWFEPAAQGSWKQNSTGASTSYFVTADLPDGLTLLQEGQVSPAGGSGILQLEAISTIQQFGDFLEFFSVGSEIDEADAEASCPPF